MKERPILFSAPMVRAILEGRKTQTRRTMKSQPWARPEPEDGLWRLYAGDEGMAPFPCPYGQPGDRLWVRETWTSYATMTRAERAKSSATYEKFLAGAYHNIVQAAADIPTPTGGPEYLYGADFDAETFADLRPWRPSIHMSRRGSRILLEITGVRVERVQEISEKDALAEGCRSQIKHSAAFADLWDSINAKRGFGWDANPWVWVIEFKRVKV